MTQLDAVLSSELGSQAQSLLAEYSQPGVLEQAGYLLIAVGSLIFVIAFLGYCGALQESRVLLTAYALFITLMFGLQIAAIVLAILYQGKADEHTRRELRPADHRCVSSPDRQNSYFNKGCYNKFVNSVKNNQVLVLGAMIGLGCTQFLIILFSFCLCRAAGR